MRLTVDTTEPCASPDAVLEQLRIRSPRIREARSGEPAPSLRIEVRPEGAQVFGRLTFEPLEGPLVGVALRREVRGSDCESVVRALGLVAVVVVDPSALALDAVSPPSTTTSAPGATPPAERLQTPTATAPADGRQGPTRSPVVEPAARSRAAAPLRMSVGAGLEVASGLGPQASVVPRAFVDLVLPGVLSGASARLSLGRGYTQSASTPIGVALITLTDVRLDGCYAVWSFDAVSLRACALFEDGVLSGEGTSTDQARSQSRNLAELGLGLQLVWLVRDPVALGVLVGGAIPLARYRFYFTTPDTTAYRLAAWSTFGEFSVSIRFL